MLTSHFYIPPYHKRVSLFIHRFHFILFYIHILFLLTNFRLCLVSRKHEKKYKGKKIKIKKKNERKIINNFKINKLFLYVFLKLFYFFII